MNPRAQDRNNQARNRDDSINNKVKCSSDRVQIKVKVLLSGDRSSGKCPCPQQGLELGK